MGGTNGCKCAYDKNLSVGYETVVAINDGGRAAIKSANSFQFGREEAPSV